MRIQYARMWFLRDRKCKSNKSEAWEDELVHQNGNREVIRWLPFSPFSPCPSCSEPWITSSVRSNAKSLSSPSPGGSSSPRLLFSLRFPCILVQLGLLFWLPTGLCPQAPHITLKCGVILLEEKPDLNLGSISHCSSGSNPNSWSRLPGPSGWPQLPLLSRLFHIQVWCIHTLNREGKSLLLHSTHFIFLSLLFFLAPLLLLETFFFTMTHSVTFLTTSSDLWIKLDWNHLVRCLLHV